MKKRTELPITSITDVGREETKTNTKTRGASVESSKRRVTNLSAVVGGALLASSILAPGKSQAQSVEKHTVLACHKDLKVGGDSLLFPPVTQDELESALRVYGKDKDGHAAAAMRDDFADINQNNGCTNLKLGAGTGLFNYTLEDHNYTGSSYCTSVGAMPNHQAKGFIDDNGDRYNCTRISLGAGLGEGDTTPEILEANRARVQDAIDFTNQMLINWKSNAPQLELTNKFDSNSSQSNLGGSLARFQPKLDAINSIELEYDSYLTQYNQLTHEANERGEQDPDGALSNWMGAKVAADKAIIKLVEKKELFLQLSQEDTVTDYTESIKSVDAQIEEMQIFQSTAAQSITDLGGTVPESGSESALVRSEILSNLVLSGGLVFGTNGNKGISIKAKSKCESGSTSCTAGQLDFGTKKLGVTVALASKTKSNGLVSVAGGIVNKEFEQVDDIVLDGKQLYIMGKYMHAISEDEARIIRAGGTIYLLNSSIDSSDPGYVVEGGTDIGIAAHITQTTLNQILGASLGYVSTTDGGKPTFSLYGTQTFNEGQGQFSGSIGHDGKGLQLDVQGKHKVNKLYAAGANGNATFTGEGATNVEIYVEKDESDYTFDKDDEVGNETDQALRQAEIMLNTIPEYRIDPVEPTEDQDDNTNDDNTNDDDTNDDNTNDDNNDDNTNDDDNDVVDTSPQASETINVGTLSERVTITAGGSVDVDLISRLNNSDPGNITANRIKSIQVGSGLSHNWSGAKADPVPFTNTDPESGIVYAKVIAMDEANKKDYQFRVIFEVE